MARFEIGPAKDRSFGCPKRSRWSESQAADWSISRIARNRLATRRKRHKRSPWGLPCFCEKSLFDIAFLGPIA